MTTLPPPRVQTSHHAVERLQLYYPHVTGQDLLRELSRGTTLPHTGARWLGIRVDADHSYVLHRERTGVFVIRGGMVATFLRFDLGSYVRAAWLWPGEMPTCTAEWAEEGEPTEEEEELAERVVSVLLGVGA